MYKILFATEAESTVESVNEAFLRETGETNLGYDTQEDIDKGIREGFLEFSDGKMTVYADIN